MRCPAPHPTMGGRATITTSHGARRGTSCRDASRSTRRARLRTTAPPMRRPTAKAMRGASGASRAQWYKTNSGPVRRRPRSRTSWISEREVRRLVLWIRELRPRGSCGPWCAAGAGRPGPRASACACGSRGGADGAGCGAGTCASWARKSIRNASRKGAGRGPEGGCHTVINSHNRPPKASPGDPRYGPKTAGQAPLTRPRWDVDSIRLRQGAPIAALGPRFCI